MQQNDSQTSFYTRRALCLVGGQGVGNAWGGRLWGPEVGAQALRELTGDQLQSPSFRVAENQTQDSCERVPHSITGRGRTDGGSCWTGGTDGRD